MRVNKKCRRNACGRILKRNTFIYCSVKCQQAYQHEQYIQKWLAGDVDGSKAFGEVTSSHVRRYLMEREGAKCVVCGWGERNPHTGRVPLHLDHIDGNAQNNRPENLRLLCPNHHALTPTYGNANKGNGRPVRRARYLKGIRFSPLIYPTALRTVKTAKRNRTPASAPSTLSRDRTQARLRESRRE